MIVAEFIASCRTEHGIPHAIACRALEVSQSWFYEHINRAPTARERRRARPGRRPAAPDLVRRASTG